MVTQTRTRSLIDAMIPVDGYNARIARDIALIVLFSIITAGLARFSVQLPFTPVPVTGQTLAVLLAGATLGSRRGAAAMARRGLCAQDVRNFLYPHSVACDIGRDSYADDAEHCRLSVQCAECARTLDVCGCVRRLQQ